MGVYYDHEAYLTILPGHETAVRDVLTAVDESTIDNAMGVALGSLLNEFASDYTVYDTDLLGQALSRQTPSDLEPRGVVGQRHPVLSELHGGQNHLLNR